MLDDSIEIVGVAVRDTTIPRTDLPTGASLVSDPSELAGLNPDVVAEAAGRDSVAPWGRAALACGANFIVSSVSAFADSALLESMQAMAASTGTQIQIQPGAVAGVEALSAARNIGIDHVEHRMVKPPHAWLGTPAENLCEVAELTEPFAFFSANAADTATAFPKNANVAMTTALAGIGPENTIITLVADPAATTNRHEVDAHGTFGQLNVSIANAPLPGNPKSSAMAALSLARTLNNRTGSLAI